MTNDESDRPPILDVAKYEGAEQVVALLAAGADARARDATGWSALHAAAWCGDLDREEDGARSVARIEALAAGAEWNVGDSQGSAPADVARETVTTWEEIVRDGPENTEGGRSLRSEPS